jgi:hypothetical protein
MRSMTWQHVSQGGMCFKTKDKKKVLNSSEKFSKQISETIPCYVAGKIKSTCCDNHMKFTHKHTHTHTLCEGEIKDFKI